MRNLKDYIFGCTWQGILARTACVSVFIIFFITPHYKLISVDGVSMTPTLEDNDIILLHKTAYKYMPPQLNDIVVIESKNPKDTIVKRILAEPGDVVKIIDGRLYVNNKKKSLVSTEGHDEIIGKLPENTYFYAGDNPEESICGLITAKQICGKIVLEQ